MLCGKHAGGGRKPDDYIYVAMNSHWEMHGFELPKPPSGITWHMFANTDVMPPHDIWDIGKEPMLENQNEVLVGPRSLVILTGK